METRYKSLAIVAGMLKVVATILFLGGAAVGLMIVFGAVFLGATANSTVPETEIAPFVSSALFLVITGITLIFLSLVAALPFFAAGELIDLLMGIEENTRRSADAIERRVRPAVPMPVPEPN